MRFGDKNERRNRKGNLTVKWGPAPKPPGFTALLGQSMNIMEEGPCSLCTAPYFGHLPRRSGCFPAVAYIRWRNSAPL